MDGWMDRQSGHTAADATLTPLIRVYFEKKTMSNLNQTVKYLKYSRQMWSLQVKKSSVGYSYSQFTHGPALETSLTSGDTAVSHF